MNFKEALIAHLQGEQVEVKTKGINEPWEPLFNRISNFTIRDVLSDNCGMGCEFRLAPRTIFVNGVEVPAPEKVKPEYGSDCFIPMPTCPMGYAKMVWTGDVDNVFALQEDLLYLKPTDAITRAKAMLLTSDK